MSERRLGGIVKDFRHSVSPTRPPRSRPPQWASVGNVLRSCSFCGRGEDEVSHIVAGANAFICGGCIFRACDAMADSPAEIPPERINSWMSTWEHVGQWLLDHHPAGKRDD
jgi:hypothetical protein